MIREETTEPLNSGFELLGILVIALAFVSMAMHPYQKGRAGVRGAHASGPAWFVILLVGIGLIAVGLYVPG
jgi:hypothetical protein